MERMNRFLSTGWIWIWLVAPIFGLGLPLQSLAAERQVGKKVADGMSIRVWVEEPQKMQMLMQGKWMTYRPKAGALTHHLAVDLTVPGSGERIPYATVSATLSTTGKKMTKKLPAMFGKHLFYGANLKLDEGKYDLVINVDPPGVMRMEGAMNKWTKPIQAKFTFEVK